MIISFQVSAELQGNMRLAASDQGATRESENSIISPAIISASSNDFLGDWWRQMLQKWEPTRNLNGPESEMAKELKSDRQTDTSLAASLHVK